MQGNEASGQQPARNQGLPTTTSVSLEVDPPVPSESSFRMITTPANSLTAISRDSELEPPIRLLLDSRPWTPRATRNGGCCKLCILAHFAMQQQITNANAQAKLRFRRTTPGNGNWQSPQSRHTHPTTRTDMRALRTDTWVVSPRVAQPLTFHLLSKHHPF